MIVALVELKFIECVFCVSHHLKHFECIILLNTQNNPLSIVYQSWSQKEKNNQVGKWGEFNKGCVYKSVASIQKINRQSWNAMRIATVGSHKVGAVTGTPKDL